MCLNPYCWYPFLKSTDFNDIIQTDCFKSRIGELTDTDDKPKSPQSSNQTAASINTAPLPQSSNNSSSPQVPNNFSNNIPDKNTSTEPTTSTKINSTSLPPITDVYARENSAFCCITETQKNLNFNFTDHLPSEIADQYENTSLFSVLTSITYLPKLYQHRFSNEIVSSIFNLKNQLVNGILRKPVKRARKNEKDDYHLNFKTFEDYLREYSDSCIGMVLKLVSAINSDNGLDSGRGITIRTLVSCEKCGKYDENFEEINDFSVLSKNSVVFNSLTDKLVCIDERKPYLQDTLLQPSKKSKRKSVSSQNVDYSASMKNGFCNLEHDCECGSDYAKKFTSFSNIDQRLIYFCIKTKHGIDSFSNIPEFEDYSWRMILIKHESCKFSDDCYLSVVRCVDPDVTRKSDLVYVKEFRGCKSLIQKARTKKIPDWKTFDKIKSGLITRVVIPENVRLIVYERNFEEGKTSKKQSQKKRRTEVGEKRNYKKTKLNTTL